MATQYKDMPEILRKHFAAEGTGLLVGAISGQAGIVEHGAVAGVIYRLLVKDITVYDFIQTIADDIGISLPRAQAIAREVKERIFEPQRNALFIWGIDLSAIHTLNAPPLESFHEAEDAPLIPATPAGERAVILDAASMRMAPERNIPVSPAGAMSKGAVSPPASTLFRPVMPLKPAMPPPAGGPTPTPQSGQALVGQAAPLILHEERTLPEPAPAGGPKKRFFFPMNFLKTKTPAPQEQVRAQVSTSGETPKPPTPNIGFGAPKPERKVVFYGNLRTPLPPAKTVGGGALSPAEAMSRGAVMPTAAPSGPISLAALGKFTPTAAPGSSPIAPSPKPFVPPAPAPKPFIPPLPASPHIQGNTIDLRSRQNPKP